MLPPSVNRGRKGRPTNSFGTRLASVLAVILLVASLSTMSSASRKDQSNDLNALAGEWVFFEDRTEGKLPEELGPPMSSKFSFRVEEGVVILVVGHGSGHRDVRVQLDGTVTEIVEPNTTTRYTGSWKDGLFTYQSNYFRGPEKTPDGFIRKEFRHTAEGLFVKVVTSRTVGTGSVGLYRHPQDIPLPTPAKAVIADVSWLSGLWMGTRPSGSTIEEQWSAPRGGAMLASSRTVNTSGRMSAFEFLRIVEKDGGLVYTAQPGGAPPTQFVLTEVSAKRAVFENPRHDYPNRIVYELTAEGGLTATIGLMKGGTPRKFEFKREGK